MQKVGKIFGGSKKRSYLCTVKKEKLEKSFRKDTDFCFQAII